MLVRDLMGCCFGGAPQPDEWISVRMEEGGADYYPYIPVVVTGTLRVEAIEDEAGYAAGFKSQVYSALMGHVREKFLNGTSLGLAERGELSFAWKMLSQLRTRVLGVPGLIAGIIEYGDQ